MSYISNGCNDCASVDFGNNSLLGGNFMGGNGFESQQQNNQFMYQQPQQQPQMVQQMPQLPQQLPQQMPQQPKVQMMAPVKMQQQAQQQQVNVVAPRKCSTTLPQLPQVTILILEVFTISMNNAFWLSIFISSSSNSSHSV